VLQSRLARYNVYEGMGIMRSSTSSPPSHTFSSSMSTAMGYSSSFALVASAMASDEVEARWKSLIALRYCDRGQGMRLADRRS
jgi:predicted benzoate:H+ symporter BenE